MKVPKQRFFIALLPPQEIQEEATQIKQHFAEIYQSKAALKSPPHITLQPPFEWELKNLVQLEENLQNFCQSQDYIPMTLDSFAAFKPRVIYINVLKTPELLSIQQQLMAHLESSLGIVHPVAKNRPFAPHLTVGFRDLSKANFYQAWDEFKNKKFSYQFRVDQLTLLVHNGERWKIHKEFLFAN